MRHGGRLEIQLNSGVLVPRPQGRAGGGEACSQVHAAGSLQLSEMWCTSTAQLSEAEARESGD